MKEVALVIIFNHNYTANIKPLTLLYGNRFKNIFFVIPFYNGNLPNVINVFEKSCFFQGYISSALNQIKKEGFKYYLIIGDDVFLNPSIEETNFKNFFNVNEDTAFIPGPFLLSDPSETRPSRPYAPYWNSIADAQKFDVIQFGFQSEKYLPSKSEAKMLLNRHGFDFSYKIPRRMFFPKPMIRFKEGIRHNLQGIKLLLKNIPNLVYPKPLKYPLIGSYSDVIVISAKHQENFISYSGAFAALNLFVELALPTSIAFAYPKIVSEIDTKYKGETYWYYSHNECEKKYKKSLLYLTENFPIDTLYVHPIKLSKWK